MDIKSLRRPPTEAQTEAGNPKRGPQAEEKRSSPQERLIEEEYAEKFRAVALAEKRSTNRLQLLRCLTIVAATVAATVLLTWISGSLRTAWVPIAPSPDVRFTTLVLAWLSLLSTALAILVASVVLPGWFGQPENPASRKWGVPQIFHNAYRRSGQRDHEDIAPGLTRLLTCSMDARRSSVYLCLSASFVIVLSLALYPVILMNILTVGFIEASSAQVGWFLTLLRDVIISALAGTPPNDPIPIPWFVTIPLLMFPPLITYVIGTTLVKKSSQILWSFLPTPNVVREHLYYFLKAENMGRDYSEAQANQESLQFMLQLALPLSPSHFFDSKGSIAFYRFDEPTAD